MSGQDTTAEGPAATEARAPVDPSDTVSTSGLDADVLASLVAAFSSVTSALNEFANPTTGADPAHPMSRGPVRDLSPDNLTLLFRALFEGCVLPLDVVRLIEKSSVISIGSRRAVDGKMSSRGALVRDEIVNLLSLLKGLSTSSSVAVADIARHLSSAVAWMFYSDCKNDPYWVIELLSERLAIIAREFMNLFLILQATTVRKHVHHAAQQSMCTSESKGRSAEQLVDDLQVAMTNMKIGPSLPWARICTFGDASFAPAPPTTDAPSADDVARARAQQTTQIAIKRLQTDPAAVLTTLTTLLSVLSPELSETVVPPTMHLLCTMFEIPQPLTARLLDRPSADTYPDNYDLQEALEAHGALLRGADVAQNKNLESSASPSSASAAAQTPLNTEFFPFDDPYSDLRSAYSQRLEAALDNAAILVYQLSDALHNLMSVHALLHRCANMIAKDQGTESLVLQVRRLADAIKSSIIAEDYKSTLNDLLYSRQRMICVAGLALRCGLVTAETTSRAVTLFEIVHKQLQFAMTQPWPTFDGAGVATPADLKILESSRILTGCECDGIWRVNVLWSSADCLAHYATGARCCQVDQERKLPAGAKIPIHG